LNGTRKLPDSRPGRWPRPWPAQKIPANLWWRLPHARSAARHIFVLGAPRSGTTLAQLIISAHSALTSCPDETGIFTWQEKSRIAERATGIDGELAASLVADARDCVAGFDALAAAICHEHGAKTFVEKTPQHILRLAALCAWYPNARFVHVIRDGRDCLCSAANHPGIPSRRKQASKFARYWKRCLETRSQAGDRVVDLRYESLVTAPEETAAALMQQLGLDFETQQLDSAHRQQDHRAALPQFARLNEPIDDASVGCWRERLRIEDVREFERVAGKSLTRCGYPLSSER
jgi:hypothetical protein